MPFKEGTQDYTVIIAGILLITVTALIGSSIVAEEYCLYSDISFNNFCG